MLSQTPRNTRLAAITILVIAAILMVVYVPFVAFDMVNPIVELQFERIEQFKATGDPSWPLLTLTTWLVSFFYPFWATLTLCAGIAAFFILKPLYNGEVWARAVALLCFSVPSVGGAYMTVPWMNFIGTKYGGFPPAVIIMMICLIPFFAILLMDKGDIKQKMVDFMTFMALGVAATYSFSNGHAAFRVAPNVCRGHRHNLHWLS